MRSTGNAHDCSPENSRRMLPRLDHGLAIVAGVGVYREFLEVEAFHQHRSLRIDNTGFFGIVHVCLTNRSMVLPTIDAPNQYEQLSVR